MAFFGMGKGHEKLSHTNHEGVHSQGLRHVPKGTGMTNDLDHNSTDDIDAMDAEAHEPSGEGQEEHPAYSHESFERDGEGRPAYVRQPTPHRRQPPVNDLQADEAYENNYSFDSSYTLKNRVAPSRGVYRHSRSQQEKVRQELKYGQYLSVPKGNREIFGSHEKEQKRHIVIVGIAVVAIITILLIIFWPK